MSEQQKYVLHLENKVRQLEYLLQQERAKNFSLRKLLVKIRFQALPFLTEIQNIKGGVE